MEDAMNGSDSSDLFNSAQTERESVACEPDAFIDWEIAQDRVLMYLKALNVAPDRRLTLALQAFERARTRTKSACEAVPETMTSLWQLLTEHNIVPDTDIDFDARIWHKWTLRFPEYSLRDSLPQGKSPKLSAAPSLRRKPMPSAALQFALRRRGVSPSTDPAGGRSSKRWVRLAMALATIFLILFIGA